MSIVHDLRVAGRRWAAVRGTDSPILASARERDVLRRWFTQLPPGGDIADKHMFEIEGSDVPWRDTGIELREGEWVSTFAAGRLVLSDTLDIWLGPQFPLWMRIGERGTIFNGTRHTNTFRAKSSGRLYLGNGFPGQWGDVHGRVSTSLDEYSTVKGGLSVAVLRWSGDDAPSDIATRASIDPRGLMAGEDRRLRERASPPSGWEPLWFLGRSEIFRSTTDEDRPCIACHTHENVSILQHDAPFDLTPETRVCWSWKVDELPSLLPENTAASHDYLSLAVEFENGRDITYTWSPELPEGFGYWCPLPTWKDREFHVVLHSGARGLGTWMDETRDLHADYRKYMGEPPRRVVRVWLIAVSLFQRRTGRALFRDIRLEGRGTRLEIGS